MQARIEKIGDEFGLLLPKELLDACGFDREATVTVQEKALLVTRPPAARGKAGRRPRGRCASEAMT